jgi:hypothetical protein
VGEVADGLPSYCRVRFGSCWLAAAGWQLLQLSCWLAKRLVFTNCAMIAAVAPPVSSAMVAASCWLLLRTAEAAAAGPPALPQAFIATVR